MTVGKLKHIVAIMLEGIDEGTPLECIFEDENDLIECNFNLEIITDLYSNTRVRIHLTESHLNDEREGDIHA